MCRDDILLGGSVTPKAVSKIDKSISKRIIFGPLFFDVALCKLSPNPELLCSVVSAKVSIMFICFFLSNRLVVMSHAAECLLGLVRNCEENCKILCREVTVRELFFSNNTVEPPWATTSLK